MAKDLFHQAVKNALVKDGYFHQSALANGRGTMTIIIAGERSGVGKTTITLAILAYLCDQIKTEGSRQQAEGIAFRTQGSNQPPLGSPNHHPEPRVLTPQPLNLPTTSQPLSQSAKSAKSADNTPSKIHPPLPPTPEKKTMGTGQSEIQNPLVQSFKVGPDYIDPMFHTYVTGRPCRNLDPVLTSEDYVRQCFSHHCHGANYAVVEGVMGLFDGASGADDTASTAHIARLLDVPIVLVLDCSRLSRSAAAIIHGYTTFDSRLKFAGVILNRVGSDRHLHLLKSAIAPLNIPILGILHRETAITIPDRHLGLIPTDELPELDKVIRELRAIATTSLNWELLLPMLRQKAEGTQGKSDPKSKIQNPKSKIQTTPSPSQEGNWSGQNPKSKIRLAVARDRAFNFYYPDNLDLLEQLGASLVFWSPLRDRELPSDVQGLYLGGGFPEVFASQLASNQTAKASVKAAIEAGVPTYAECGGLMYLCDSIVDFAGKTHPMVGIIPATVEMGKRLSLGYRRAIAQCATPLLNSGQTLWGHEFHRSYLSSSNPSPLYELYRYGDNEDRDRDRDRDGDERNPYGMEGWSRYNLHASYVHVHWGARPHIPQRFLAHCHLNCVSVPRQRRDTETKTRKADEF